MVAELFLIFVNILLVFYSVRELKLRYGVTSMLPIGVNLFVVITGVLPSLYIIIKGDVKYTTLFGSVDLYKSQFEYQIVLLLFLVIYNFVLLLSKEKKPNWKHKYTSYIDKYIQFVIWFMILSIMTIIFGSNIINNSYLQYVGFGVYGKIIMATVIIGMFVNFKEILRYKLLLLPLLGLLTIFILANSRGLGMFPIIAYLLGYGIIYKEKTNYKIKYLSISFTAIFVLFIVSNMTRYLYGYAPGLENLTEKINLYGDIGFNMSEALLDNAVLRIFNRPSYVIVSSVGEAYSALDFNIIDFLVEVFLGTFSSGVTGEYIDSYMSTRYGFRVNEETSVGISVIGYMYQYGGILSVAMLTALFSLFHRGILWIINLGDPIWHLISVGVLFYIFFYSMGYGLAKNISSTTNAFIYVLILYALFRIILSITPQGIGHKLIIYIHLKEENTDET